MKNYGRKEGILKKDPYFCKPSSATFLPVRDKSTYIPTELKNSTCITHSHNQAIDIK